MAEYKANSPYFSTKQTAWYLKPMQMRSIPQDTSDIYITVTSETENKPTILSEDIYGTPAYWWVITLCNMEIVRDPTRDLLAGIVIRLPSVDRLHKILG
jgi:hypothetical protein